MLRTFLLGLAFLVGTAVPCSGQLIVQGVRNLEFGPIMQGVATVVAPTDPIRSGQFYLSTAAIGTRLQVRLTLPNQLIGPGGAGLPVQFSNNDGFAQSTASGSVPSFFNPVATINLTMTGSVDANVWLGGRISPAVNQPVGNYTSTVVMTVTVF